MSPEKAKDFKGSISKLMSYIGRYKIGIFAVMLFAAVATVFNVIGPKILGKATTALSEGLMRKIAGTGGMDFNYTGKILIIGANCTKFVQHAISPLDNRPKGRLLLSCHCSTLNVAH